MKKQLNGSPFIIWTLQRTGGTNLASRLIEYSGLLELAKSRYMTERTPMPELYSIKSMFNGNYMSLLMSVPNPDRLARSLKTGFPHQVLKTSKYPWM